MKSDFDNALGQISARLSLVAPADAPPSLDSSSRKPSTERPDRPAFSSATASIIGELGLRAIRPRDETDQDFQNKLRLLMEDLAHVEPTVLDAAARSASLEHKFLPTAADLNALVKEEIARRSAEQRRVQGNASEPAFHAINRANAQKGSSIRWTSEMQPFVPGDIGEYRGCDDASGRVITPRLIDGQNRVDRSDVPAMRRSYRMLGNFECTDNGLCRRL